MLLTEKEIETLHAKVDEVLTKSEMYYNAYGHFNLSFNSQIRMFNKKGDLCFEGSYYRLIEIEFFKLFSSEEDIEEFRFEIKNSKLGWIPVHPQFPNELKKKFRKVARYKKYIKAIEKNKFTSLVTA
jgi:hypothetical protein